MSGNIVELLQTYLFNEDLQSYSVHVQIQETYSFNASSDSITAFFVCEVMSCEIRPAQKTSTFPVFIFENS